MYDVGKFRNMDISKPSRGLHKLYKLVMLLERNMRSAYLS